jgi:hypothetical protein
MALSAVILCYKLPDFRNYSRGGIVHDGCV